MKEIKINGIYQHFKGHKYKVIGVAKDSETLEEMVVYEYLEEDDEYKRGQLWVRLKQMFLEEIERDGKKMERFKLIQEESSS